MAGLHSQRVFLTHADNGTANDYSNNVSTWRDDTWSVTYSVIQNYIYIGSELPFNHKYFEVSTPNTTASNMAVHYWDGTAFRSAINTFDRTVSGGATLGKSGIIYFEPNRDYAWVSEHESKDVEKLSPTYVYDFYWIRLRVNTDVTFTLKYIGNKFSEDSDLFAYYPDLNNSSLMTSFASGKTTWDDQHFAAADYMIADLKRKSLIWSPNQLLDYELFNQAAVHKVAEIIYSSMGEAYFDLRNEARRYYKESMDMKFFNIDQNRSGILDGFEKKQRLGFLTR